MTFNKNYPRLMFYSTILSASLLMSSTSIANELMCKNVLSSSRIAQLQKAEANRVKPTEATANIEKLSKQTGIPAKVIAAWEVSRLGMTSLLKDQYSLEHVVYNLMASVISQQNIMIAGPGGGAKTFMSRKIKEAVLRAENAASTVSSDWFKELSVLSRELYLIIKEDSLRNPEVRIFTQQMHATVSESKILGGPDALKYINEGVYEINYSNALIDKKFIFGILDEIEKAPVALQMTLLSILNERQALVGNQVVQTMIRTITATTNASLGEFIEQAEPHEIGGRKALLDRFNYKVHVTNVRYNENDQFLFLEKTMYGEKNKLDMTILDLGSLDYLLKKIEIPSDMLVGMVDISIRMDQFYTDIYNKEIAENPGVVPKFFPPFSGSTRSQGVIQKMWKSAFLSRQLMQGVPFESLRLKMEPADLIDLAPRFLEGFSDPFIPEFGYKIDFLLDAGKIDDIVMFPKSNQPVGSKKDKQQISTGYYDPYTQVFQYMHPYENKIKTVKFDIKTGKLLFADEQIRNELLGSYRALRGERLVTEILSPKAQKLIESHLEKRLARMQEIHDTRLKPRGRGLANPAYKLTGILDKYVNGGEAPLRDSEKKHLSDLLDFHTEFLQTTNTVIRSLEKSSSKTYNKARYQRIFKVFDQRAEYLKTMHEKATRENNPMLLEAVSALSMKYVHDEVSYKMVDSQATVSAIMRSMVNGKNVMLFGPPGSGKTMISRALVEAVLNYLKPEQIREISESLANLLIEAGLDRQQFAWIKQFHPMSTEGDILGRLDLKNISSGYSYNREGSLIDKKILFGILDEFEKAPPGVKTALLSIMNEREVFDGDVVLKSNIISLIISTNATFSQFMKGLGPNSTAFPIFDRIHDKVYVFNKLSRENLIEFQRRIDAGMDLSIKTPFYLFGIESLVKQYSLNLGKDQSERKLFSQIRHAISLKTVDKYNQDYAAHLGDPQAYPEYYMNTRGESDRSSMSIMKEFSGAAVLKRILNGQTAEQMRRQGVEFEPMDLIAYGELFTAANPLFRIGHDYVDGLLTFKVIEKDYASIQSRVELSELKTIEDLKWETQTIVDVINDKFHNFVKLREQMIIANPGLYPSLFESSKARIEYVRAVEARRANGQEQ